MPIFEGFLPRRVEVRPARKIPTTPRRFGSADSLERQAISQPKYGSADTFERRAVVRSNNIVPLPQVIGVPNPYGVGAAAFEPDTVLYEPAPAPESEELFDPGSDEPLLKGYDDAYNAVQRSRSKEAAQAADGLSVQGQSAGAGAPLLTVDGQIGGVIKAAQSLLGKPYIWGGTTARGVDCSGLLYYAFNAAGIKMPRYRAVDYGRMGQQLAPEEARAGDILFWDNPGSTDHVGIYLGNGQVLQAPQSGDVVKVSKVWGNPTYRRIVDDSAFGQMATPSGAPTTSYNGRPATVAEMAKSPVYISDKRRGRPF